MIKLIDTPTPKIIQKGGCNVNYFDNLGAKCHFIKTIACVISPYLGDVNVIYLKLIEKTYDHRDLEHTHAFVVCGALRTWTHGMCACDSD